MKDGKLGVAMMGPGRIVHRVMQDFRNAENCELIGMASRSPARAEAARKEYGAKYAFSYEEMLESPEVELVYVATPHNFHMQNAILCMEHGKHVLCEKTFALNEREAQAMADCARANGVFLMEAMWTRFFPAIETLRRLLLEEKAIGEIRHVQAAMSFWMPMGQDGAEDRLYSKKLAGGALLDLGIYPLSFCSMLLGPAPSNVDSFCTLSPTGVDTRVAIQLQYPGGATAQLMGGFDCEGENLAVILGTEGSVTIPQFYQATQFTVNSRRDGTREYRYAPEHEGHHYQFMHAAEMIRAGIHDSPVMPLKETVKLVRLMQEIRYRHGIFYPGEEGFNAGK